MKYFIAAFLFICLLACSSASNNPEPGVMKWRYKTFVDGSAGIVKYLDRLNNKHVDMQSVKVDRTVVYYYAANPIE